MTSMQGRSLKISFVWFCLITCLNAKPSAEPASIQAYHKYQQHQLQQQQQLYHASYLYDKQQQQQQQQQRLSYNTQQHYMTQQQQPLPATSLSLIQQQPQQQQQQQLAALTASYPVKPSQIIQTVQSIVTDDDHQYDAGVSHHVETRQRPTIRKRKRRPQLKLTVTTNNPNKLYRRGQIVEVVTIQTEKQTRRNSQKQAQPTLGPQQTPLPSFEAEATKEENIKPNETVYSKPVSDLKSLLKQSGGSISLSEILQRKNVTLEDLIKGKQQALQALQTTEEPYNETKEQTIKPVRSNAREDNGERLITLTRQREKLYGNAARPLTLKRKNYESTIKNEASIVATTPKNFVTYVSTYKKSLNQRNTLKPAAVITTTVSALPIVEERANEEEVEDLENQQHRDKVNANNGHEAEDKLGKTNQSEEIEGEEEEEGQFEDYSSENSETTTVLAATTSTTTTTDKPFRQTRLNTTLRRNTTPNLRNSNYDYRTSRRGYPSSTSTTTTTTTTTTADIVTTTASSSTMNLTPKASYTLNTNDLKERLQESLLKNLIEKEKQQKKPDKILPAATTTIAKDSYDDDDELENFLEEAVKTKIVTKAATTTLKTTANPLSAVNTSLTKTILSIPRATVVPEPYVPDFDNIDDRTDLLELIEDHRSGNSLFKVLQQRNMSLEQLIEHRKRGSSQLHLATIVQNPRGLFPDKKVVLQDNLDIVTAFENFPHFNLLNLKSVKPDDIKTDSQGSSYFTSIIDIEPTDEIYKRSDASNNAQVHIRNQKVSSLRIVADRNEKSLGINTPWNNLALASLPTTNASQSQTAKLRNYYLTQPKLLLDPDSNEMLNDLLLKGNETIAKEKPDYQMEEETNTPLQAAVRVEDNSVEEIMVNEIVQGHDLVDLELSGHGFKRSPSAVAVSSVASGERHKQHTFYTNMPAGIKSAIVASATIVLTAIITFMIVFAVCRWKQRHVRGPLDNNSGFSSLVRSYNAMKHKLATATGTRETGRCSSSLQPMSGGVAMVATITTTTPHSLTRTDSNNGSHSNTSKQLQRQSSLLMLDRQRPSLASNKNSEGHTTKKYTTSLSSGLTKASNRKCKNTTTTADNSNGCDSGGGGGGVGLALMTLGCHTDSHFGSTTSLALSLKSSTAKLNAGDTHPPGVQEYFFDTVRDSF